MLKFVSHIGMMIGLGAILYIIARTLPRIDDTISGGFNLKTDWVVEKIEATDRRLRLAVEKFLRRFGVALMKLQNATHKRIVKMKKSQAEEAVFSAGSGELFSSEGIVKKGEDVEEEKSTDGGVVNRTRL